MPRQKCDMYDLCSSFECTFGICEPSDESDIMLATSDITRCKPSEKIKIAILASIDEKLSKLLEK